MHTYSYCNTTVRTDSPLPELMPADVDSAEFTLRPGRPGFAATEQRPYWTIPGSDVRVLRDASARYWSLEFSANDRFYYEVDRNVIWSGVQGNCEDPNSRHFLLDQVLPRVLSFHDQLMLHSSVVELGGGAVAFMASTGAGKSSLALAMHELGRQVLCDDCFGIEFTGEDLWAIPTYRSIRMWPYALSELVPGVQRFAYPPAAGNGKCRVSLQGGPSKLPLIGICLLKNTEPPHGVMVRFSRCPMKDAFMQVLNQTFRLDAHCNLQNSRFFGAIDQLVHRIPVFDLNYRRGYEFLPQVCLDICEFFDG